MKRTLCVATLGLMFISHPIFAEQPSPSAAPVPEAAASEEAAAYIPPKALSDALSSPPPERARHGRAWATDEARLLDIDAWIEQTSVDAPQNLIMRDILLADDLTMINFEGTLTTAGRNPEKRNNSYLFRAKPEWVEMLPAGGVDTVSLENNHVLDMGEEGLAETKRTLLSAGISYASEGEPAIFTVKGVTIGSTVVVERLDNGAKTEFALVGSQEANHKAKPMRLSDESPFGKAVMGHREGDVVTIDAPAMSFQVKIITITK